MANNIALAKTFVPILDEIYKLASLTSKLDGAAELARQGANANELIVPMLSMQGLGDYSRNDGYVKGDVTMTNETIKCNYDRGRKFYVDALDEQETAKVAFSRLSGEFIRTKQKKKYQKENPLRRGSPAGGKGEKGEQKSGGYAAGSEAAPATPPL